MLAHSLTLTWSVEQLAGLTQQVQEAFLDSEELKVLLCILLPGHVKPYKSWVRF